MLFYFLIETYNVFWLLKQFNIKKGYIISFIYREEDSPAYPIVIVINFICISVYITDIILHTIYLSLRHYWKAKEALHLRFEFYVVVKIQGKPYNDSSTKLYELTYIGKHPSFLKISTKLIKLNFKTLIILIETLSCIKTQNFNSSQNSIKCSESLL